VTGSERTQVKRISTHPICVLFKVWYCLVQLQPHPWLGWELCFCISLSRQSSCGGNGRLGFSGRCLGCLTQVNEV